MALLTKLGDDYTKTGKGTLTRWSNFMSYVPGLRTLGGLFQKIPVIGGTITAVLGYAGTLAESAQWLLRGQFGSAATVAAAGIVGTSVNAITDTAFWWANSASGVATGETLGTHARALTESVIGKVTGALGAQPTVLRSYPAGIGSIGGAEPSYGVGRRDGFVGAEAARRGQTADDAWARLNSNEPDHLAALQSAQAQGGYRSI